MKRGLPAGVIPSVFIALFLSACAPLIADYNAESYKTATTLKAETQALIDKSGDSFANRRAEIDATTTRINAAYEYAAGLPSNQLSAQQWDILRDPNGDFYGGYIRMWRQNGSVGPVFRSEKRQQIGRAFDYIICLEANKKEARACLSLQPQNAGAPAAFARQG
jgi:hypothetical protein